MRKVRGGLVVEAFLGGGHLQLTCFALLLVLKFGREMQLFLEVWCNGGAAHLRTLGNVGMENGIF